MKFRKIMVITAIITMGLMSSVGGINVMAANSSLEKLGTLGELVPVYVDDNPIEFGNAVIMDRTTYVAISPIFEKLGYKVEYDNKTMTIKIRKGKDNININLSGNTITGTMEVNGEKEEISGFIDNVYKDNRGMTLIPARSISENLFCDVVWDGSTVWIYSSGYTGEKREAGIKEQAIVTDEAYISTVIKITSDGISSTDYIKLEGETSEILKEFNSELDKFLKTASSGEGYEKDGKVYKNIIFDSGAADWKPLDALQARAAIMDRYLDRLRYEGITNDTETTTIKGNIRQIYDKARRR